MPYEYKTTDAFVRPRRTKDKDARSTTSSTSGRRQRETSRSSNRSPPQTSRPAPSSLYTQQNTTNDQLPPLPESGTVSPLSAKSPVLRASSCTHGSTDSLTSAAQIHTPAALQPYLDYDEDEPSSKTITRVTSTGQKSDTSPGLSFALPEQPNKFYDSHTATPLAVDSKRNKDQHHPRSASPGFFPPSLESNTTALPKAPSPKLIENAPFPSPSPPPSTISPFWGPPVSAPGQLANQPYSQSLAYVGPQQAVAPPFPIPGSAPGEHYFASPYGGPQYIPFPQPADTPMDFHSFYPPQGSVQQGQVSLQALRSPPIRHGSPSSSISFSGDSFHGMSPPTSHPTDSAAKSAGAGSKNQGPEDDAVDLLQRIQRAIPDLHALVNKYRETSGRLGERESRMKESEAHKAAALKQKEGYIQQLAKELEGVSAKHSAESSKLRLEIGNMEEKHKGLQDSLAAEKKSKSELEVAHRNLQVRLEQAERALQEKEIVMTRNFDLWKRRMSEEFAMKQRTLEDEIRRARESEAALQAQLGQIQKFHTQEKDGWFRRRRELETSNNMLRRDLDDALEARKRVMEENQRKQQLNKEAWDKERTVLGKGTEEQRKVLVAQHQLERDELEKTYKQSEARIRKQAEECDTKLHNEIGKLRAGWDSDKIKFNKATTELKAAANKLNDENIKLQKLTEALGNITELKPKGDPFYHDAFNSLQSQISHLAVRYFRDGPKQAPNDVIERIPKKLSSILSNTDPSKQLRVAYIEHMVSSAITHQIFEPFLFTLAIRRKSMDNLVTEWSESLWEKSKTGQTFFRQQILHAAYTSPSAKQSINKAAMVIVDNILDAITPFADQANWESIRVGIRRIVKLAAETWRYAALEKAAITASLFDQDRSTVPRLEQPVGGIPSAEPVQPQLREILLPLFPTIERQPMPEELRGELKEENNGCLYTPGRMLYADDDLVLASLQKLGPRKENVSAMERPVSTDVRDQAKTPTPMTETQGAENKSLKVGIGERPTSPLVRDDASLSPMQPSFIADGDYLSDAEKMNVDAESALPTVHEDFAAIPSTYSRSRTPPIGRRSTNANENGSFSDRASISTALPAALPDWGDADGAVPHTPGGW